MEIILRVKMNEKRGIKFTRPRAHFPENWD